jgi:hypothetical protein
MLGDLWAHLQIPAGMTAEQARMWLQASEQEATPEAVQEIVELSASMGDRSRRPGHDRGIAHADEIWFPLGPRRLLILGSPSDQLPEQRPRPAAQTAVTVNRTIAASAYEHIYMHPAQDQRSGGWRSAGRRFSWLPVIVMLPCLISAPVVR